MTEHAYTLLAEAIEASRVDDLEARYFWLTVAGDRLEEERRRYHRDLAIAEGREQEEPT